MEDESILNKNPQEVQDYLNELAIAVCIKGDKLEKYEKMAIKRCGNEAYANMKLFVEEVKRSVERGKFTNTSKVNLSYLGKNAGLSKNVVSKITKHFEDKFSEKDREEDNLWNQCYPGYKPGYQNYLNRYPNGKYSSTARSIIADLERKEREEAKERAEREERNFWNKCQTSDKSGFLKYLDKYPYGKYASTARSILADLERKEKEKEEREQREQKAEQQMWDQCRTKDDYQRYLDRYPYGVYASKAYVLMLKAEKEEQRQKEEAAQARLAEEQKRKEKERQEREKAAEQAMWKKCLTKEDFQNYLNHYPYGKYTRLAYDRMRQLEAKMQAEQAENELWLSCKTELDYLRYLKEYPNGIYRASAKSRIAELGQKASRESVVRNNDGGGIKDKKKALTVSLALLFVGILFIILMVPIHAGVGLLTLPIWIVDIALLKAKWEVETDISHALRYVITGLTVFYCFLLLLIII